jgi:hypothetical protein
MHNAGHVCCVQCIGDLDAKFQDVPQLHGTLFNLVLEGLSLQEFHGNKDLPLVLANLINSANIGMVERRCGAGFPLKSCECLTVLGQLSGKEFQSHKATEFDILSLVDDTHAAAAELLDDAIVRDSLADHGVALW